MAIRGSLAMTLGVRVLSEEEREALGRIARSRTVGAGRVRRAQIVLQALEGLQAPEISARMDLWAGPRCGTGSSASTRADCKGWRRTCAADGRRPTPPNSA